MQVVGRRQAQRALQQNLPRRGIEQVGAAHHVADALRGVVDHHRQLVGPATVGAQQHEIADLGVHVLGDGAAHAVAKRDHAARRHSQAQRRPRPRLRGHAAMVHAALRGQFAAAATAGERLAGLQQPLRRGVVGRAALALARHRSIRVQTVGAQAGELALDRAGRAARPVHVLDAQQPLAAGMARVQPATEGGEQRAQVQRAAGRGRETAAVGRRRHGQAESSVR